MNEILILLVEPAPSAVEREATWPTAWRSSPVMPVLSFDEPALTVCFPSDFICITRGYECRTDGFLLWCVVPGLEQRIEGGVGSMGHRVWQRLRVAALSEHCRLIRASLTVLN